MVNQLVIVLIALALAYILGELSRKIGLPRVVGQLSAGLILGIPAIKNYLFSGEMEFLSFLANLGVVLLFYYIGLETNIRAFTKNIRLPLTISLLNTLLPAVGGFFVMKFLFGFSTLVSLIIGISLGISALTVSLDMLEELKMIKTRLGKLMISSGVVDDIVELVLIAVFFSIFRVFENVTPVTRILFDIFLFTVIIFLFRALLLPSILKLFGREKSSTALFTGALLLVLLIASFAEFLGVGLFIGGLVAGILIRQTIFKDKTIPIWEEHDISKSIQIITFGFLMPIFFVSVGLNVDFVSLIQEFWLIVILVAIAIVGTIGGTIIAVLINRGTFRSGLILGWGINPKGDVNLAIAALAFSSGVIAQNIYTSLVMMALLTTIISAPIFKHLAVKYPFSMGHKRKAV